jgi:predicted FMN-binding regulatory protein PaiB
MGYTSEGENRPSPWKVSDAPHGYIDMKKNIIGIEVTIEKIGGKFKISQEIANGDREGVIEGFNSLGTDVGISNPNPATVRRLLASIGAQLNVLMGLEKALCF